MKLAAKTHSQLIVKNNRNRNTPTAVNAVLSLWKGGTFSDHGIVTQFDPPLQFNEYVFCPELYYQLNKNCPKNTHVDCEILGTSAQVCNLLQDDTNASAAIVLTKNGHTTCMFKTLAGQYGMFDPWDARFTVNLSTLELAHQFRDSLQMDITQIIPHI
jgi:hypothetical protein